MNSGEDSAPVFRLMYIAQLYKVTLEPLGLTIEKGIHATGLKNRLNSALSGLRAFIES